MGGIVVKGSRCKRMNNCLKNDTTEPENWPTKKTALWKAWNGENSRKKQQELPEGEAE